MTHYSAKVHMLKVLLLYLAALLVYASNGSASRVIFPPVPNPEFNTPAARNGFVGGPTNFAVTGNITIKGGCAVYEARGMIVIIPAGGCRRERQYEIALEAGASGLIFFDYDRDAVGRKSRIPLSSTPLEIPIVIVNASDFTMLVDALKSNPYVTVEITPGVSLWHQTVGDTVWFLTFNAIFGAFYVTLLGLVIFKFIRKVKPNGFIWNISFVYLLFQAAFCILMIVRWIDPVLTYGIFIVGVDALIDTWPATWSFAAQVLMAFFWFEVINQFADTKVQPFLSKKMQIPFWIVVAIIILLPIINVVLLVYVAVLSLFVALLAIQLGTGIVVAGFYIIVAIKALQVVERSERLNAESKSRARTLKNSRVSIVSSAVIACIYPPLNFALRYNILYTSFYYALAALLVESVLLGIITFIQVWYMPDKNHSATPPVHEPNGTDPALPSNTNNIEEEMTDVTTTVADAA